MSRRSPRRSNPGRSPVEAGRLRPATPDDSAAVAALMQASIRGIFPTFYDAAQTEAIAGYYDQTDPALIADGTYFVIEEDGEVVACGGWSRRPRLPTGTVAGGTGDRLLDPATEPARIRLMFVRPDRVRRGLATRILQECEKAARSEGFRRLALMATLPGISLYERNGFRIVERTQITLPNGITLPSATMEKEID